MPSSNRAAVLRDAARRIAVIVVVVVGVTAAVSVTLGALAHRNLAHSIAVGYYIAGVAALLGTLAFGLRGPMRREAVDSDRPTGQSLFVGGARKMRRTTAEERVEARRSSVLFFVFGIFLVALGAAVDPTRSLL